MSSSTSAGPCHPRPTSCAPPRPTSPALWWFSWRGFPPFWRACRRGTGWRACRSRTRTSTNRCHPAVEKNNKIKIVKKYYLLLGFYKVIIVRTLKQKVPLKNSWIAFLSTFWCLIVVIGWFLLFSILIGCFFCKFTAGEVSGSKSSRFSLSTSADQHFIYLNQLRKTSKANLKSK